MFFGKSQFVNHKQGIGYTEKDIKSIIETEIYSAILDFINVMTERKGATSKKQERVAREFYFGIQEIVKNTVRETIENILQQNPNQKTSQSKKRKSNIIDKQKLEQE